MHQQINDYKIEINEMKCNEIDEKTKKKRKKFCFS